MPKSLALIHTVTSLVPVFETLVHRHLPDWAPFNIVDESLLRNTIREGHLSLVTSRRLAGYVWSAADAGAEAIMVTCSSVGPAVDAVRSLSPVPLMRVDEGMAEKAVGVGNRIGIMATLSSTLDPTRELVSRHATLAGRSPILVSHLCEGAFDRLAAGDRAGHDALIAKGFNELAKEVDVVVLAQASMASAVSSDQVQSPAIPVLSSPELGVLHLKSYLDDRGP
jgi:Asp/Glu/hydantoin racemase